MLWKKQEYPGKVLKASGHEKLSADVAKEHGFVVLATQKKRGLRIFPFPPPGKPLGWSAVMTGPHTPELFVKTLASDIWRIYNTLSNLERKTLDVFLVNFSPYDSYLTAVPNFMWMMVSFTSWRNSLSHCNSYTVLVSHWLRVILNTSVSLNLTWSHLAPPLSSHQSTWCCRDQCTHHRSQDMHTFSAPVPCIVNGS